MKIKGYKGFDKDFKCQGFQFEQGKEYHHDGEVKACQSGFHLCENPLDVWNYYPLNNGNRYADVEGLGELDHHDEDSKVACENIKIGAEISLKGMIEGAIKFIFEKTKSSKKTKATTGDRANAATTGDGANAATTGDRANAATTGDGANAAVGHKNAIAAALGIESATKGILGSWIVVAEWVKDGNRWTVKSVKAVQVDGKKVKADTFYMLKDGKLEEVK
jgi:hypothetical protein